MDIFMIILGVLMVLCGGSCIFTPLRTFAGLGYFLIVMLMVYGIVGIVKAIASKKFDATFVFSIISVIVGIIAACIPGLAVATDGILLYVMAGWFIIQGVVTLFTSIKYRGSKGGKKWIFGIILGILGTILGIYSIFHPLFTAFATGILIGMYFIESGINMIVLASQSDK